MYLSNKKFIDKYFDGIDNVDEVLVILTLILVVLEKDPSILKLKNKLEKFEQLRPLEAEFVKILKYYKKLNIYDISKIIYLLKNKYPDYTKSFEVFLNEEKYLDDIQNYLENKFGKVNIDYKNIENVGLYIGGEGYYFKKYLEDDLNKLLKI